jgi:hypothetical protein
MLQHAAKLADYDMGIFDTNIVDSIVKAINTLGTEQAKAIIEGFERAAHILADKLEQIEKEKEEK